jgi:hypothetical protein
MYWKCLASRLRRVSHEYNLPHTVHLAAVAVVATRLQASIDRRRPRGNVWKPVRNTYNVSGRFSFKSKASDGHTLFFVIA